MSGGPDSCDVLIVGSGLSGLTSAYRVLQADCTRSVVVTDALDYFGGRTKSIDMPEYKTKVSVGGTFSLFEHHDTLNLAREVGCYPKLNLPISGVNWNLFSQDLVGYLSTPLGLPLFLELMWKGSKVVNGGQILWDCSTARKLDKMSLETWINNQSLLKELNPNFTREFFYLLETYPDLATVSALQCAIALWVRFRGIPRNGFELPPQTLRWEGGTGVFTSALVDLLRSFGPNFRLLLNSPVDQIVQPQLGEATDDAFPVKVTINQDRTRKTVIRAKYVIVATSPLACAPRSRGGNIEYQPSLPNDATMLFSAINATPTVALNILVIYERPWWRKYGGIMTLPEYSRHVHEKGVYGNVVDGSMSGDDVFGVARIFCDSRRVENWAEDEIKAGAIDFLKKLFPTDEQVRLVENFVEIRIWNWNNTKPTLPGVTFTFPPSGALSTYGHALTQPHGRIHWGGSERSVWGSGWMEGAVERGNDVAQEVLREAGWVPADYDVRNHGFIAAKSGGASPMAFLSEPPSDDEFSDDDIDSEWTELIPDAGSAKPKKSESKTAKSAPAVSSGAERSFVPKTRLDLVAHLFTDEQHRTMSYQAKLDHLGRIEKSADGSPHWISPQACLAALKELHDIKLQKSDSAACDGSRLFACPAGRAAGDLEKASGCVLC